MHDAHKVSNAEPELLGHISRAETYALNAGHFQLLPEIDITIFSILHFMPGIMCKFTATNNPLNFHVYNTRMNAVPRISPVARKRYSTKLPLKKKHNEYPGCAHFLNLTQGLGSLLCLIQLKHTAT